MSEYISNDDWGEVSSWAASCGRVLHKIFLLEINVHGYMRPNLRVGSVTTMRTLRQEPEETDQ